MQDSQSFIPHRPFVRRTLGSNQQKLQQDKCRHSKASFLVILRLSQPSIHYHNLAQELLAPNKQDTAHVVQAQRRRQAVFLIPQMLTHNHRLCVLQFPSPHCAQYSQPSFSPFGGLGSGIQWVKLNASARNPGISHSPLEPIAAGNITLLIASKTITSM